MKLLGALTLSLFSFSILASDLVIDPNAQNIAISDSVEITFYENAKHLIKKGVDTGRIHSFTRKWLGMEVEYRYKIIRINDNLTCFSPLPKTKKENIKIALLNLPLDVRDVCTAKVDISVN